MRIGENDGQCYVHYAYCYIPSVHCAVLMGDSAVYSTHIATFRLCTVLYLWRTVLCTAHILLHSVCALCCTYGGQCCVQHTYCYGPSVHCAVLMADSAVYSTHIATVRLCTVLYLCAFECFISIWGILSLIFLNLWKMTIFEISKIYFVLPNNNRLSCTSNQLVNVEYVS